MAGLYPGPAIRESAGTAVIRVVCYRELRDRLIAKPCNGVTTVSCNDGPLRSGTVESVPGTVATGVSDQENEKELSESLLKQKRPWPSTDGRLF